MLAAFAGKETRSPEYVRLVTDQAKILMKDAEDRVRKEAIAREQWADDVKKQLRAEIREEMREEVRRGREKLLGTGVTDSPTALEGFVAPQLATTMLEENASQEPNGWAEHNNDLDSLEMLNGSGDMSESMRYDNEEEGGTQSSVEHGGASAASSSSPDASATGAGTRV